MNKGELPDPEKRPDICLVLAYKTLKGVPWNDENWNRIHFGRCLKSAKRLLEVCGSLRAADTCVVEISARFEKHGLSWTLETILKHAHEWVARKKGPYSANANPYRAGFFRALIEQGRTRQSPGLLPASEALPLALRSREDSKERPDV